MSDTTTALVIPPSPLVRQVIRPMTKLINPVMKTVAGRRHMGSAAVVLHKGRKSGREYATTTGARLAGDEFLIPLTFGTESDWCRNLRAGGGAIRLKGKTYTVDEPEVCTVDSIRPLVTSTYPLFIRSAFKLLGIKAFIRIRIHETTGRRPAASDELLDAAKTDRIPDMCGPDALVSTGGAR